MHLINVLFTTRTSTPKRYVPDPRMGSPHGETVLATDRIRVYR